MARSLLLRGAFLLVHIGLVLLALTAPGNPLGDVEIVYKPWVEQGLFADYWVGINTVWVYPIMAMLPMLAAHSFGPALYALSWLLMVVGLNAAAFLALTGWRAHCRNVALGWWWLAFLALLGPIALTRIDSVTVPLAIIGVLLLAKRPHAAGIVLAVVTWMKVWPAAIIVAVVLACRERMRVVAGALGASVVILVAALALGSGANVLSFIGQQGGRGLQIEAPVSLPWLWLAAAGVPDAGLAYDQEILTFQVWGGGVDLVAALMTPILAVVIAVVVLLGLAALRRGVPETELLPPLALALLTAFIAFNKVGSPQFISWLAVAVILGALWRGSLRAFAAPAVMALVLAAATQGIYPYLYDELIALNPLILALLTLRNLLVFVLFGWAVAGLIRLRSDAAPPALEVGEGAVAAEQDTVGDRPLA